VAFSAIDGDLYLVSEKSYAKGDLGSVVRYIYIYSWGIIVNL